MRFRCIGDEDVVRAFGLAGIEGRVARDAPTTRSAWRSATKDPACGVVLMTEELADLIAPELEEWRIHHSIPLVALLPGDTSAARPAGDFLRKAIGLRIEDSTGA